MHLGEMIRPVGRSVLNGLANPCVWLSIPVLAGLTWLLAISSIDAWVNDIARLQNADLSVYWSAFPMLAGMVVPALVPVWFWFRGNHRLAVATLSAFLVALIIVSLLKGLFSRVHPEALEPAGIYAKSVLFRFGLFEAGFMSVVEGWPSGHTATNGAVALTAAWLSANLWIKRVAYFWFGWVVPATVFGISGDVHWLSDTVAGFALAWLIARRQVAYS